MLIIIQSWTIIYLESSFIKMQIINNSIEEFFHWR